MKHSKEVKPLFRNCPNANIFSEVLNSDCRRCELYEDCIRKRSKRRKQKQIKLKARKRKALITVLVVFILILLVKFYNSSFAKENENQLESEPTSENADIVETQTFDLKNNMTENEAPNVEDEQQVYEEVVESEENIKEKLIEPRISAYEPGEVYYYNISKQDKIYMAKLLYKEARGELYEGKVAVACTVLNRYYSEDARFERESIYSVITQSGAYASIDDVTMDMVKELPDLEKAVEDACLGWDPTRKMFESGALFFYAPKEVKGYQKEIREGITVLQIGNHNFHNDFNM